MFLQKHSVKSDKFFIILLDLNVMSDTTGYQVAIPRNYRDEKILRNGSGTEEAQNKTSELVCGNFRREKTHSLPQ